MKKIFLVLLLTISSVFAQYEFAEPKPTFDEPRKVILSLYDKDLDKANHIIGTVYNLLKEYPSESLKVIVVAYGPGMRLVKKDGDANLIKRMKSLMEYDVEFVACKNTMETMKWKEEDFIDDLRYVQAGLLEVIEKQVEGFININPY